jgi:hypothetical protein
LRSGLADEDFPVSLESFTGDFDIDLEVLGAASSTFLTTGAFLISDFWDLEGTAALGAGYTAGALILRMGSGFLAATGKGLATSFGFSCFTCGLAEVTLTSGFLNSSLMTGLADVASILGADALTGEAVFFLLSDLFAYYLAGDSDLTAAALLGSTSLASTFMSASLRL